MISKTEYRMWMWPLKRRPAWNRKFAGWNPSPVVPKDGPTPMIRFLPNINHICDRLMGVPEYGDYDQKNQERVITSVKFPDNNRRLRIFREALEMVVVTRSYNDLLLVALHRRQVTATGDMPLDLLFLRIAETFSLSAEQWETLAQRMPVDSWVFKQCKQRARVETIFALIAAE